MSADELKWQDEILQMMYWMKGESLAQTVTLQELNRFLNLETSHLQSALQQLIDRHWLEQTLKPGQESRYSLSERGLSEGKRRFVDEFSGYLGKESHLVCDDPNCDCHLEGWTGSCTSSGLVQ